MSSDLFPRQPLYAFIELRIKSNVITNVDGYLYQDDNGYGNMSYDFRDDNSKMVMNMTVKRTTEVPSEFNLTLFDDTAVYAEAIVASVLNSESKDAVEIEYGWASGGQKIIDRSYGFRANLTEYSISFSGPSTTLDIVGIGTEVIDLAQSGIDSYSALEYHGSPSEVVKAIALAHGWNFDETTIVATQPIQDLTNEGELMTFVQGGRTVKEFIEQDLTANAISLDGDVGYTFWVSDNSDGTKTAYFKPIVRGSGSTYISTIIDSQGGQESTLNSPNLTEYAEAQAKCVRHYNYYSGTTNSEVISFTPSCSSAGQSNMSSNVASIDSAGEAMTCNIQSNGNNINIDGLKILGNGNDKSRMMGISTTTYQRLEIASRYLWNFYAGITWEADIELMGDPGLKLEDTIEVNLYTKYGFKHHTSGIYRILEVEDSVEGGSFITTLHLTKEPCETNDTGAYNSFGEGTTEAPGGQKVDGGKADITIAANNSIVASLTPLKDYPVPNTNDWTEVALSQLGANEEDGTYKKYLDYLELPDGSSWDVAFILWCLDQAGSPILDKVTTVKALLDKVIENGMFKPKEEYIPLIGDIFIQRVGGASHAGFIASVNPIDMTYETIEGNCAGAVKTLTRRLNDPYLSGFCSLL